MSLGKTKNKIASFAAVPDVIRKGVVIDSQRRGNGNYDRIVVAAPITISADKYIMGVMLQRDHQSQRMVLHDVVIINEKETTQSVETTPSTTEVSETSDSLYMTNILQKAISVNNYSMPENKSYSLPDNKLELLRQFKEGQLNEDEIIAVLENEPKENNPISAANLKPEDANTTPTMTKRRGQNKGDKESNLYGSLLGL